MILLSYECKLKLIELARVVRNAKHADAGEAEDAIVLIAADELVKILPPEITEEV